MSIRIAPSILSADFARLADGVAEAEEGGADWIHVDVMDGRFVPNITIGVPVVAALRRVTDLPLDVHLMIDAPERYVDAFVDAGADWLTVHQEASVHLHRTLETIRHRGARAGVSINPGTPAATLDEVLPFLDLVLVMSVNPGFGGQSFIPSALKKIEKARRIIEASGRDIRLEVDGGIKVDNIRHVADAGADTFVAGSAIFGKADYKGVIDAMREALNRA